ncbi:MAG: IPT/TIG domain-containing protein [Microgenomates group bacterium]
MTQNIYERIHDTLTWKRILSFNLLLFLVLIIPLSVSLSQQSTENRSNAAEEAPAVTPPPNYPTEMPKIDRVSTFFGKAGDTVVILGSNFGEYQWGSRVFVGNSEAAKDSIVRWSNNILEVKIPDSARTGSVWIVTNGKEARWDGSLLLYDVSRAAQIGIQKTSSTTGKLYTLNATGVVRGMVELAYTSEPLTFFADPAIVISSQTQSSDSLGKKLKIVFESPIAMDSGRTEIASYSYPGLGAIEIIRAELYDGSGKLISIFSDPLTIKVRP